MLVVIALGGNALLKRGEPMDAAVQRANVKVAAEAVAEIRVHGELAPEQVGR
jgi:carbamate kinase